ncbi:hypothetical protein ACFPK1_21985 [Actinomycetospora rhizophila]|uniref:Uncharacterized protein n=1 Tax=Actinomycetospora rhizophila TaxID=1416876 RepID=A0ABV9ZH89_9PSEU
MSTPGGDAGRAAQERLTEEARATASALIDWLSTRVDAAAAGTHATPHGTPHSTPHATPGPTRTGRARLGMRPPQSPGPCSWCPVCALVAALRGEQPELTARLAEQASGLMVLLRLMVQAHQEPAHTHAPPPPAPDRTRGPGTGDRPPAGWPAEWGAWDAWGATPPRAEAGEPAGEPPAEPPPAESPPAEPPTAAPRPRRSAGGPGGRRVPIRRASPRSAAFRDVTGEPAASASVTPDHGDVAGATAPPPTAHRGATPTDGTTPPAGAPRPSVQRIAIRRPERPGRSPGRDGPEGPVSC